MPRIYGVKERYDQIYYDTHVFEPGTKFCFFRSSNVGNLEKTNLQTPGQTPGDCSFIVMTLGVRVIDASPEEAARALDHIRFTLMVGDMPQLDLYGPQLWMAPGEHGYKFSRPVVIPPRQTYNVAAKADKWLPGCARVRVHLAGLVTRDVP